MESCTCLLFAEPEWSSLCWRQFAPIKCNAIWGNMIMSSKIKTCHTEYWWQKGKAWKRQLSIEIYIVQRANVYSTYWQQTCNIFYWGSLCVSLCVFRYLRACMRHYWICCPKSSASVKCHFSVEFVNVTVWQQLSILPSICVLLYTKFKWLNWIYN